MKTLKIILLLFCIILGLNAKAQTVGYTYKALYENSDIHR